MDPSTYASNNVWRTKCMEMLTTNISIFKSFLVMHMCIKHNAQIFLILETERFRKTVELKPILIIHFPNAISLKCLHIVRYMKYLTLLVNFRD